MGNTLAVYGWVALGLFGFLVLVEFLHWHHCHRTCAAHRPVGYLILLADGVHNLVGGLAAGSVFVLDIWLGISTWLVAAAHEVPQELGDFGLLIHSGWSQRQALAYDFASALTFLVGSLSSHSRSRARSRSRPSSRSRQGPSSTSRWLSLPQFTTQECPRIKMFSTR